MRKKGETLVETLIGMLIVSIASVVLVTGITVSIKVNRQAKEAEAKFQFTYTKADPSDAGEADKLYILDSAKNKISEVNVTKFVDANGYKWFE